MRVPLIEELTEEVMRQIKIYDTTLRDGTQAEDFNLSLADKIRIAQKLAQLGIHYIEGGWPAPTPRTRIFSPKSATTTWG
jgi:2-isopropylmalate synthase